MHTVTCLKWVGWLCSSRAMFVQQILLLIIIIENFPKNYSTAMHLHCRNPCLLRFCLTSIGQVFIQDFMFTQTVQSQNQPKLSNNTARVLIYCEKRKLQDRITWLSVKFFDNSIISGTFVCYWIIDLSKGDLVEEI